MIETIHTGWNGEELPCRGGRKAAEEDACRMEHIISEEVFLGIKRFMSEQSL